MIQEKNHVIPVFMLVFVATLRSLAQFHVDTCAAVVPGLHIRLDLTKGARAGYDVCVITSDGATTKGNPKFHLKKWMGAIYYFAKRRAPEEIQGQPRYVPSPVWRILLRWVRPWPQVRR